MTELRFPDGFLWGTATAAHQVEGGNWNNDWWAWEHSPGTTCIEPSGDTCDAWHRWPEDVALAASLGFNVHRFSLEWSRIEPEEGEWSTAALDHYRRVCAACHEGGLTPMVTFHHFTTPRWAVADGGWERADMADRFARFCERATEHLGDLLGGAFTLNEPNIVATMGWQFGVFPPGRRDLSQAQRVVEVLVDAHRRAQDAIKAGPGDFPVGLTLAMQEHVAVGGASAEARLERIRGRSEDPFLHAARGDDVFGVQTYSRLRVGDEGVLGPEEGAPLTKMGYEDRPEALEHTLRRAAAGLGDTALLVTENGISTDDDTRRIAFVGEALAGVRRCLDDGIDVRGYTYWTLLDNFEWAFGYGQPFGLVAVDRTTFERRPKPSAAWLGEVARTGRVSRTTV